MQVILLEKIDHLGQLGDTVTVKPGYARNFLLPNNKALRATKENIAYFDAKKAQIEKDNAGKKVEAEKEAKKLNGLEVIIIRAASEAGKLYGAVSARDIADAINEKAGTEVSKNCVVLNTAYKDLGLFPVTIALHGEVKETVTLNIARSVEEAGIQKVRLAEEAKEAEKRAKEEKAAAKAAAAAKEDTTEESPAEETAETSEEEQSAE